MARDHRMNYFSVTVPAGINQFKDVRFGDSLLIIKEASAPFEREFDNWGRIQLEGGFTEDVGEDRFKNVRIFNLNSAVDLTVSGYVGRGSGKAGIQYDYLRTRSTKVLPSGLVTLADGTGQAFPGVSTAADFTSHGIPIGSRRKHAIITAYTGNLSLVKGSTYVAANLFGILYGDQPRIVEGDEPFFIHNATGGSRNMVVEQHFYV